MVLLTVSVPVAVAVPLAVGVLDAPVTGGVRDAGDGLAVTIQVERGIVVPLGLKVITEWWRSGWMRRAQGCRPCSLAALPPLRTILPGTAITPFCRGVRSPQSTVKVPENVLAVTAAEDQRAAARLSYLLIRTGRSEDDADRAGDARRGDINIVCATPWSVRLGRYCRPYCQLSNRPSRI